MITITDRHYAAGVRETELLQSIESDDHGNKP